MTASTATVSLIELDDRGVAWIRDANPKVLEVTLDKIAYGLSPADMHMEHPHLSLAQIHAALSYDYAHQVEMDAEMARQQQESEAWYAAAQNASLQRRLRELARQGTPAT